jgi:class 3 adenylate cyclase
MGSQTSRHCATVTTMRVPDDPVASGTAEYFPGSNPHPVLQFAEDGQLTYANESSAMLLASIGARVGEALPETWQRRLADAATTSTPIELKVGPRTFELLAVRVPHLGFLNVYGTDVTAARAIVKFPDQNPNPVFRLTWDGVLVYANAASRQLVEGLGWRVGAVLPDSILEPLLDRARAEERRTVEVVSGDRRYRLLPVDVPEFEFINVYGTDVTAAHELEAAYRENERLLLNILPEPVADRLRRGERPIADRFEDISLLFADIVGFTSLSGGMAADELVSVLDEVFSVFDELVDGAGVEKVKTIGDAYMVVGGMTGRDDHLECLARMALSLGEAVQAIETARHLGIEFRIGIHCGPVVAGVIGTRKFIYDVWGDTVNVASRMESTGVPGRVQVTAAVEARLRDGFTFESRGLTEVRGKGPMPTFFLTGVKPGSSDSGSATVRP